MAYDATQMIIRTHGLRKSGQDWTHHPPFRPLAEESKKKRLQMNAVHACNLAWLAVGWQLVGWLAGSQLLAGWLSTHTE